jgi:hypothetical protein
MGALILVAPTAALMGALFLVAPTAALMGALFWLRQLLRSWAHSFGCAIFWRSFLRSFCSAICGAGCSLLELVAFQNFSL